MKTATNANKKDSDVEVAMRLAILIFQLTDKIPVIFLNLRGYDSHSVMLQIGQSGF